MTMTLLQSAAAQPTDAELVAASRRGDREAFGRIVRRYQAMITGVIYAACGDLHRSEDIAQDTFISAWKSLSGLREPAKLPAWLCQVARHRVIDDARSETRRDTRLAKVFQNQQEAAAPAADEQLLSEEEREVLWRTLREIAQPYRETLVLYYRQGNSVADVAVAMETSEDNVRQRLARGREMLREHVAAMLERNLARSAPSAAFAVAVVAALPALIPQTTSAATIGSAALKGTAVAAKGTGLLAIVAMWIGPVIGFFGGVLGTWNSVRHAQHPDERRFVVRLAVFVWVFVFAAMGVMFGLTAAQHRYHWTGQTYGLVLSGYWAAYIALLVTFMIAKNRQHRRLRERLGLPALKIVPPGGERGRWLAFAGASVAGLSWMFGMALQAKDTTGAAVVSVASAVAIVVCRIYVPNRPISALRRFAVAHVVAVGLFTLVVVNWRMYLWMAAMGGTTIEATKRRIPLWTLNLFTFVICLAMLAIVLATLPRRSDETSGGVSRLM